MKNNKYFDAFEHYEALSCTDTSIDDIKEVYKKMEYTRAIHLPETFEQRKSRRVSNPFKFDFFISKVTPGKKIKWLPTNSPEKKSKLNYKPASYFLDKLESLKGKSYLERQLEIIKELDEKTKIS